MSRFLEEYNRQQQIPFLRDFWDLPFTARVAARCCIGLVLCIDNFSYPYVYGPQGALVYLRPEQVVANSARNIHVWQGLKTERLEQGYAPGDLFRLHGLKIRADGSWQVLLATEKQKRPQQEALGMICRKTCDNGYKQYFVTTQNHKRDFPAGIFAISSRVIPKEEVRTGYLSLTRYVTSTTINGKRYPEAALCVKVYTDSQLAEKLDPHAAIAGSPIDVPKQMAEFLRLCLTFDRKRGETNMNHQCLKNVQLQFQKHFPVIVVFYCNYFDQTTQHDIAEGELLRFTCQDIRPDWAIIGKICKLRPIENQMKVFVKFTHTESFLFYEQDAITRPSLKFDITRHLDASSYKCKELAVDFMEKQAHQQTPKGKVLRLLVGSANSLPALPEFRGLSSCSDDNNLTTAQQHAIMLVEPVLAKQHPIVVINGPPGSGKLFTAATMVVHLAKTNHEKSVRILACAPSNAAASNLAMAISHLGAGSEHVRVLRLTDKFNTVGSAQLKADPRKQ